jgi:AraC-like DNA-binding protein
MSVVSAATRLNDAQILRNMALPEVELRLVTGQREWGFLSPAHQVIVAVGWHGQVWHRRVQCALGPGQVIVAAPHQMVVTKTSSSGFLACLSVERVLLERLTKHGCPLLTCGGRTSLNEQAAHSLDQFVATLRSHVTADQLERSLVGVLEPLTHGIISSLPRKVAVQTLEQIEGHLESEGDVALDLQTLSEQLGTSRFAALRAFKKHFGLPPHTYQIHLRIAQALPGLRAGHSPARVAVDCGFFDQSHFTRHFKRVIGTTPAHYARSPVRDWALALA